MKNKIDLAKLPIKKLAKKWIKANFDGSEKKFEIRELTQGERMELAGFFTAKNVNRTRNTYVLLLSCGLEIDPDQAELIYDYCTAEAIRVGDEIYKLSKFVADAEEEEMQEAEKNSEADAGSK
jgi:hypothetical protein